MNENKKDLWEMKYLHGICRIEYCSGDEQIEYKEKSKNHLPLPNDIIIDECGEYFKYVDEDFTEREIRELLELRMIEIFEKQLKAAQIIKVVVVIISVVFSILALTLLLEFLSNQFML